MTLTAMSRTWPRSTVARWAGGLYVAYVLASILASRLGNIGLSDSQTLRETIAEHETLFRMGLVAALASALLFVLTAWALYTLLRPVNEPLALLLLVLNAIGVAVQCASYLPLLAVLAQHDTAVDVSGLTAAQLDGLALLSTTTYKTGFIMTQLFFSAWLFPPRPARAALGVPAAVPRMAPPPRRDRGARLVPAGVPSPGPPRHQLPVLCGRLRRRARTWFVVARPRGATRSSPDDEPELTARSTILGRQATDHGALIPRLGLRTTRCPAANSPAPRRTASWWAKPNEPRAVCVVPIPWADGLAERPGAGWARGAARCGIRSR